MDDWEGWGTVCVHVGLETWYGSGYGLNLVVHRTALGDQFALHKVLVIPLKRQHVFSQKTTARLICCDLGASMPSRPNEARSTSHRREFSVASAILCSSAATLLFNAFSQSSQILKSSGASSTFFSGTRRHLFCVPRMQSCFSCLV